MFGFQRKPELPWGGLEFAGKLLENTHYLLMGSSGSGKTVSLSMLLRRALESRDGLRHPAIVYDPKQSFYPELRCFSFGESPLVLSNPMDTRSSHWAIGRDYSDTVHATQLAATLIPRVSEKDRFFTDGARTFLFAVVTALQERLGTEWTLRDLVEGCSTKARLSALLSVTDEGAEAVENFFAESGERGERRPSSDDVFVTLSSVLQEFRVVDGAFTPSSKRDSFSVQECLSFEDPRVLFISKHDKFKAVLEPFNRLLFTRAFEEVLSREATSDQRIWFFIDELATAGKLPELRALMDEGRSHGARVVLSFQDINGLYETYKREASEDILGQCGNRSFLRLEGGSARRWVEEQLGDSDVWEAKFSRKGSKEDWEFQQRTKKNFNGSQMQSWPKATLEDGFRGIFLVQGQPPWPKHVSPRFIDKHFCGDKKGKVFVRRAVKRSVWTEGDWERLGLDPPAGASSNDGASDPFPPDDEQPKGRASRRHNVL